MRSSHVIAAVLLAAAAPAAAQRPAANDPAAAIAATHAWWRAFTVGDTARVAALATADLTLTLSTSETFDRAGAVRNATVRGDSSRVQLGWADETASVS